MATTKRNFLYREKHLFARCNGLFFLKRSGQLCENRSFVMNTFLEIVHSQ